MDRCGEEGRGKEGVLLSAIVAVGGTCPGVAVTGCGDPDKRALGWRGSSTSTSGVQSARVILIHTAQARPHHRSTAPHSGPTTQDGARREGVVGTGGGGGVWETEVQELHQEQGRGGRGGSGSVWYLWHHPHLGTWRGARVVKGDSFVARATRRDSQTEARYHPAWRTGPGVVSFNGRRPTRTENRLD